MARQLLLERSKLDKPRSSVTLVVEHVHLSKKLVAAVDAEADRVVRFWHPSTEERRVHLRPIA